MRLPGDGPCCPVRDIPARCDALVPVETRWRLLSTWIREGWRPKPRAAGLLWDARLWPQKEQ